MAHRSEIEYDGVTYEVHAAYDIHNIWCEGRRLGIWDARYGQTFGMRGLPLGYAANLSEAITLLRKDAAK